MAQFDAKTVHKNDWGVIGGGGLVLVASLLPWFSINYAGLVSHDWNGWGSGLLAWFGVLCAIAAAGIVAARVFGVDLPTVALGWRTIVLALAGLATLCIALKLLTGFHGLHRGIGLYLGVVGAVVEAAFAYFAFAESGERADIDRMRAERAANRAAAASTAPSAVGGYDAPPTGFAPPPAAPPMAAAPMAGTDAPPAVYDAPPVTEAPHDHGDHEGHDHPHE